MNDMTAPLTSILTPFLRGLTGVLRRSHAQDTDSPGAAETAFLMRNAAQANSGAGMTEPQSV